MRIINVDPIINIDKIQNKDNFVNSIISMIMSIAKENVSFKKSNKKIEKLKALKIDLTTKKTKLESLVVKSDHIKNSLSEEISLITNLNNKVRNELLEVLQNK